MPPMHRLQELRTLPNELLVSPGAQEHMSRSTHVLLLKPIICLTLKSYIITHAVRSALLIQYFQYNLLDVKEKILAYSSRGPLHLHQTDRSHNFIAPSMPASLETRPFVYCSVSKRTAWSRGYNYASIMT